MNTLGKTQCVATAAMAAATPFALASMSPAASAAPTHQPAAATAAPAVASGVSAASRQYLAVVRTGTTFRLQVVDRKTGKVVRTVATTKGADGLSPFGSVDLAADGSVYSVLWLNSARPHSQVVKRIPGENVYTDTISDSLNRTYGATPVNITPKTFPFKGTGTVVSAAF